MNPVQVVEGRGVPLDRSDVDTDQIIPSQWLKRVERTGFGRGLFSEWRDAPDFVLNQPMYQGATILLGRERFGTGSSREHAVWALMDYGFRAIVASSFGDIFKNNAVQQGLVTVELAPEELAQLLETVHHAPDTVITIDVASRTIEIAATGWRREFSLSERTRERLLNGWDDIGITLTRDDDIHRFERHFDRDAPPPARAFDADGHLRPREP